MKKVIAKAIEDYDLTSYTSEERRLMDSEGVARNKIWFRAGWKAAKKHTKAKRNKRAAKSLEEAHNA